MITSKDILSQLDSLMLMKLEEAKRNLAKNILNPETFPGRFAIIKSLREDEDPDDDEEDEDEENKEVTENLLGKISKAFTRFRTNKERRERTKNHALRTARARYRKHFEYDPPDDLETDALHRWVDSPVFNLGPIKRDSEGP